MTDDATKARAFTMGSTFSPNRPSALCRDDAMFLCKMVVDEYMELLATLMSQAEAKEAMTRIVADADARPQREYETGTRGHMEMVADQADALVDAYYYSLDAAARRGINLSRVFAVVHAANMAKRDPATGKFIKRSDGKILKPMGWEPPNVVAEITRQYTNGSWSTWPWDCDATFDRVAIAVAVLVAALGFICLVPWPRDWTDLRVT